MKKITLYNVCVDDLPLAWRQSLTMSPQTRLVVHIEEQVHATGASDKKARNPMFGIWRDRVDMEDVEAYIDTLRERPYIPDPKS